MKDETLPKPVAFRPDKRLSERIEKAKESGINISKMLNDIIAAHMDEYLVVAIKERKREIQQMQKALSQMRV